MTEQRFLEKASLVALLIVVSLMFVAAGVWVVAIPAGCPAVVCAIDMARRCG